SVRATMRQTRPSLKKKSTSHLRKRIITGGAVFLFLGIALMVYIRYWSGRSNDTESLKQAIARQLNRHPDHIQINVPPIPGLYPGAVIVHPAANQLAILKSQGGPAGLAGPAFTIKGAAVTDTSLTLHAKIDFISQMLSDSDRFSATIDLTDGRVLAKDLDAL